MKNIAIIYHSADYDGILSNEVCRHWLRNLHPDAAIHSYGWNYGEPAPNEEQRTHRITVEGGSANVTYHWTDYDAIYIVDLSIDELMGRPDLRDRIVWIDHHKTAIEKWVQQGDKKYGFQFKGYRIDGVAACRLCWQWFDTQPWFDKTEGSSMPVKQDFIDRQVDEPTLLRLAGEYDIWDHRDPDAATLQLGLRALTKQEFSELVGAQFRDGFPGKLGIADVPLNQCIWKGRIIQTYVDQDAASRMKAAYVTQFEGLRFLALNGRGNSLTFKSRIDEIKPRPDALMMWYYDGNQTTVSLYHAPGREDIDLSLIAKRHGGGGHRGACGFTFRYSIPDYLL